MESPPPLPPPLPKVTPASLPPLSAPKKAGLSGYMIGVITGGVVFVLVILGVLATIAIPTFTRVRDKAKAQAAERETAKPLPPLTAEQKHRATQFGILLVTALNSGSRTSLEDMTDFGAFADRSLDGFNSSPDFREKFIKGLKGNHGGIMAQMLGNHARMLRLIDRDGFPALTLRLSPANGGVNYVDVLIRPDGDTFKLVDRFTYLFGAFASGEARQAMVLLQSKDKGAVARLLGLDAADAGDIERLSSMSTKLSKHDFKGIVTDYDALTPSSRKARTPFTSYTIALQNLQRESGYDKKYITALKSAREILGNNSAMDLLLFDLYLIQKDYKSAQQCIDRVRLVVGDDAVLFQLQGFAAIKSMDLAVAEHCLAAAEKLEPGLASLEDLRLQVPALKGDFPAVVAEFHRFARATGKVITPALLKGPVYDEFKKSPEFAEWAKHTR